ncbi:hypothetical protein GCM10023340_24370 [Nocardioides marinquilinus]|uniref:SnoaL-like domain-containing protein n=1 Tax=Nocardioides marinquilinus TaxID=1210400 RepID=A0ABP9PUI3_9ACTN
MTDADVLLRRYASAIDARDWTALRAVLADDFEARFVHTGETHDADAYVAFNRDYPGAWRFVVDDLVADGSRGVLRARVTDGSETFHVAVFATAGDDVLTEAVEVWTEAEKPRDA